MLYTQQGCDNNNPTIWMWLVLQCVCWTEILLKCSLCKSQRAKEKKKSARIKTSEWESVGCFFGCDHVLVQRSVYMSCSRKMFVKCFVNFVWVLWVKFRERAGPRAHIVLLVAFSKLNTDLEGLVTEALRNFLLGDKSLGQSAGIIYVLCHLTTWKADP